MKRVLIAAVPFQQKKDGHAVDAFIGMTTKLEYANCGKQCSL